MNKPPFNKPATTYVGQIALLRQRGLIVDDDAQAAFYLSHLNYYRLCAYWLPFEATHAPHCFKPDTHFSDVLNLYVFDRELRLLMLDAIERIEVSARAQWSYCLAHHYGTHGYLDSKLALSQKRWQENKDDLLKEVNRSDEIFIKHFVNNHADEFPPVWAACEVMSLGLLSRWYFNLSPKRTRAWIAKAYGADEDVLASWLHHLSIVRNLCAHHSRLWNREFAFLPKKPIRKPQRIAQEFITTRKLYNSFIIVLHFMDVIAPHHHWRTRLKQLLAGHSEFLPLMDFPADWQARAIWQEAAP